MQINMIIKYYLHILYNTIFGQLKQQYYIYKKHCEYNPEFLHIIKLHIPEFYILH
jgi:hypothetical protein